VSIDSTIFLKLALLVSVESHFEGKPSGAHFTSAQDNKSALTYRTPPLATDTSKWVAKSRIVANPILPLFARPRKRLCGLNRFVADETSCDTSDQKAAKHSQPSVLPVRSDFCPSPLGKP
jgi:hypothetical protein